jgi:hypothetical protein
MGWRVDTGGMPATTDTAFEIGQTVTAQGGGSHIWTLEVIARTAKFVTLQDLANGETVRVKVRVHGGHEWCSPFGSYSMAPVACSGR